MKDLIDQIMAIMLHQTDKKFHPLTCGNIECNQLLLPSIENGCIILKCPQCNFIQEQIPFFIMKNYYETIKGHVFREDVLKTIGNLKS